MGLFGGGGDKKIVTGYKYYLGMLLSFCVGKRNPEDFMELRKIVCSERVAWSGSITQLTEFKVNNPNLFGGEKNEGGVQGDFVACPGEPDQEPDGYLVNKMPGPVPAFRGIYTLVLRRVYLSANNPYIKPISIELKYIFKAWYAAKAECPYDTMNPAHILYECLTNPDWGMGYPAAQVDSGNFQAAADTLHAEGFGLSLLWSQEAQLEDFMQLVIDHIGAVYYTDPTNGRFRLTLIRGGYDPSSLPVFGPDNVIKVSSYQRQGWGETINEIVVVYTDRETDKKASVTVQDGGNIEAQGTVISERREYRGIVDPDLATRVAMRDLKAGCTPLAKLSIQINRRAWSLRPGDLFKFTWPKLGITEEVYRIGKINTGTLESGVILVEAVQDIFSLPDASYADIQAPGWVSPNNPPAPALFRNVQELPYWYIAQALGDTQAQQLSDLSGYLMALGVEPSGDAFNYDLLTKVGSEAYVKEDQGSWVPLGQIASAVGEADTLLSFVELSILDEAAPGLALLGGTEFVEITVLDVEGGTATVNRGMLDTVPVSHPLGSLLYFVGIAVATTETEYFSGEQVDAKMLTLTTMGQLEEASAPADSVVMDQRQFRPYPPGKVELNGAYFPGLITGELTVTWKHRDRLLQTSPTLVTQDDPSVGPEAGTTYTIRVYGQPSVPGGPQPLIKTQTGETGESWTYPEAEEKADSGLDTLNALLRVEVEAVRDGVTSWTYWSVLTSRDILTTDIDIRQVTVPGDNDLNLG